MLFVRALPGAVVLLALAACPGHAPPAQVCDGLPLDAGTTTVQLQRDRPAPLECGNDQLGGGAGAQLTLAEKSYVELSGLGCSAVSVTPATCGQAPLACSALHYGPSLPLFQNPYLETVLEAGSYNVMLFNLADDDGGTVSVDYASHRVVEGNDACASASSLARGEVVFSRVSGPAVGGPSRCALPDAGVSAWFKVELANTAQLTVDARDLMHLSLRDACNGPEVACATGVPNCFFCQRDKLTSSLSVTLDAGTYFLVGTSTPGGATAYQGTGFLIGAY